MSVPLLVSAHLEVLGTYTLIIWESMCLQPPKLFLIFLNYFRYTLFSDVWDLIPFWQNDAGVFLWPDEFSSPDTNHIKWVFDDTIATDIDGKIMNDVYQDDWEKCPFDMDQWKYESGEGDWIIDETLTVTCTSLQF